MSRSRQDYAYLWLALFVLTDVAIFSSRAVHLDEPFFIALAKTPRDYGLFFRDSQWVFFGLLYPMFGGGSHPPAVSYYVAALYSLFGEFREVPFRLFYSLFGIAAAFGFYGLARRRCTHPLAVTLLFLASPAFFVMSETLMMDVPMLGFLLLGLHFYFERDDGEPARPAAAAICFSLSALSGYTTLVPLACLFVSVLLTGQPKRRLLPIASAFCVLGLWLLTMMLYYDKNPVDPVVRYFQSLNSMAHNLIATPSFIGGVTVAPWLFLVMRRDRKASPLLIIVSALSALLLSIFIDWKSIRYGLTFIVLASSGIALLLTFGAEGLQTLKHKWTTLDLLLFLWLPTTAAFFVLVGQFISARYVLLAMPPLYLTLFNRATARTIAFAGVPTLVLSVLVATADYRFVNTYPEWVAAHVDPLQKQGFHVLGAAESGLRFYLEQRGIPTLSTSDLRPKGGDLIVRHSTLYKYSLAEDVETMLTVIESDALYDRFPIRTFSQEAGAGFHGSSMGVLPYALSRVPHDRLEIAEVNPLVIALPQVAKDGQVTPMWSKEGPILIQRVPELSYRLRLPQRTELKYELDGEGSMEIVNDRLTLRKIQAEPIVWKNLRIVPKEIR
jgi:hypothetical protein